MKSIHTNPKHSINGGRPFVPSAGHSFYPHTGVESHCVRQHLFHGSSAGPFRKWPFRTSRHSAQLRHLIRHACLPPPLLDLSLRLHSKPSMSGTDAPNHCRICFLISSGVASCRIEFNKVWILLANLFGSLSCRPLQANLASTLPGSRALHGSCRALHHCVCY